jgi:hypothetical protein
VWSGHSCPLHLTLIAKSTPTSTAKAADESVPPTEQIQSAILRVLDAVDEAVRKPPGRSAALWRLAHDAAPSTNFNPRGKLYEATKNDGDLRHGAVHAGSG